MQRTWPDDELRALPLEALDERYRRYRLSVPEAERAMAGSLRRYGQMSPVVVCLREERAVLVDGFKRLTAARSLRGLGTLLARRVELDERSAKAAVYALNCVGRQPQELEEAWIVQALVREDGLSQVETAELLGHHKSWVCRRLALLEKLCHEAREGRMENWLHHRGRGELALCDRRLLRERFQDLVQQGRLVAELSEDFLAELTLP
jgi:hypothetical protein